MTDRAHSITIVLARDVRVDDLEPLMEAMRHLRGVLSVSSVVSDPQSHMAEMRAKDDLRTKFFALTQTLKP